MERKQSIVILGAGFGGLRTAIAIAKKIKKLHLQKKYDVILLDKNSYHTYTPTLYEAATTSKTTANYPELQEIVAIPIGNLIRKYKINFIRAAITTLDLIGGDIHYDNGRLKYDYLILAIGSEVNYFDIPGLKENSLSLKTFIDALAIRNRILNYISDGKKDLKIVIGGGGSTGVELAGEIQGWLRELRTETKNSCDVKTTIIEAAPNILPGFEEKIIESASIRLKKIGVNTSFNEVIDSIKPNKILLKSGREIHYDIFIWTGGVKASSLMQTLPLKREEKRKQIVTVPGMECLPATPDLKLYGKIYALGDAICFYDPITEKTIPKVARAALVQADVVANNIIEDIKAREEITSKTKHRIYQPITYPYVIPIGGKYAIAKLGSIIISGFWGWIFKILVELNYLLSITNPWQAVKLWSKGLRIFIKNDRLG
ncbi:MAG: NAD(P)/FAD-dependent oxidoreductase [bacterium]|nr:NAD(P)/FAD-dependent oxidoreductase [bacterium]